MVPEEPEVVGEAALDDLEAVHCSEAGQVLGWDLQEAALVERGSALPSEPWGLHCRPGEGHVAFQRRLEVDLSNLPLGLSSQPEQWPGQLLSLAVQTG